MTQAKYLADLLALQVLSTNVAHHINRGDCDALAAQASTRHIYSAVHVVIVDPRFARGSSLRVSYVARRWPHDPALASPIVYDVDDVYRLGVDERWRIADRTEKSLH